MDVFKKYHLNDPACKFKLQKTELIISTFAINVLSLALPIMVLQVYDRILLNNSVGTVSILAFGVSAAIILEAVLRMARSYSTTWIAMMYEYTMAANAMRLYINADPAQLPQEGVGKQIQNLGTFSKLRDFYGGQALVAFIDIPFAILFLVLIYYLTGPLVIAPIVVITILAVMTYKNTQRLKVAMSHQDTVDDKRYNFIIEALQGIHTIKSYGVEAVFQRRYERMEEDSTIANYKSSIISSTNSAYGGLFNELMVISVVSFGAPMVINQEFSTGALIATVLLSGRLMQPIQKTLTLWSQYQNFLMSQSKAEDMFSMPQIIRKANIDTDNCGDLEIKNLSFGYGDRLLFKNINLKLQLPNVIAIHGKSNAGKSSFLRLIAGVLEPNSGKVMVNGVEATNLTSEELVKHIGLVTSENTIFQGTIMENLSAFNEANEPQAMKMAKLLGIDKDVSLMPKGFETKITDGVADSIAPGVKQRIAIARVLIYQPKLILFNNADKGLDVEGYNHLVRLLNLLKGRATMIICTDDYNINALADREYVLEDQHLREIDLGASSRYDVKPYRELKL